VISDYHKDKKEGNFAAHTVTDVNKETGEVKEQVVYILKEENIGKSMCIDEKMNHGRYTTILSNQQTGKIAMLIDTAKPQFVKEAIQLFAPKSL
jgi:hypothetical protein